MPVKQSACADVMKVLSDQTRMAVVEQLLDRPQHVYELNRRLCLDPTLLSHHLRVLRDAGLVVATRQGKALLYRLAPGVRRDAGAKTLDFGCCKLAFR